MDKENQSHLGVVHRSRAAGPLSGPVGKTFQTNESRIPIASKTPRKALGDVNSLDLVQAIVRKGLGKLDNFGSQKGPQKQMHNFLKPPAPASKPPKQKANRPKAMSSESVTPEAEVRVPSISEAKEAMHNTPETDNFDDIWSVRERPSTYMAEFRDWRPAQIGEYKYSEDDPVEICSDEEYEPIGSSLFSSISEPLQLESIDLQPADLMLPPLEDMFDRNCDLFSGLS